MLARDVIETRRDLNPDLLPSMETPAHTGPSVSCRPGRGLNPDLLPSLGAPCPTPGAWMVMDVIGSALVLTSPPPRVTSGSCRACSPGSSTGRSRHTVRGRFHHVFPRHQSAARRTHLVVPRRQVDYLFDLPEEDYAAVWATCSRVATALKAATGCRRVVVLVVGYEIAHAHVHLIPTNDLGDVPFPPVDVDAATRLAATAEHVRSVIG